LNTGKGKNSPYVNNPEEGGVSDGYMKYIGFPKARRGGSWVGGIGLGKKNTDLGGKSGKDRRKFVG